MNEWLFLAFDLFLLFVLVGIAWLTCSTREIRRAVSLFVAFGLVLAVIWARLKAPDLALAEAVIGAGISGALLLSAMGDYRQQQDAAHENARLAVWAINGLVIVLFVALIWGLWHALERSDGVRLAENALAATSQSGVSNPVTAVLLNFRAYDTLLELAVVFTSVLAVLALGPKRQFTHEVASMQHSMVGWLAPVLIIVSGYLLWVGAHAPGGAFQAGSMLAAAFILMQMSGVHIDKMVGVTNLRWSMVVGIAVFTMVGLAMLKLDNGFLFYRNELAKTLIIVVETAATFSIAVALTLAYLGGRPEGWEQKRASSKTESSEESAS